MLIELESLLLLLYNGLKRVFTIAKEYFVNVCATCKEINILRKLLTRYTSQYVSEHWNYVYIIDFENMESCLVNIESEYIAEQ